MQHFSGKAEEAVKAFSGLTVFAVVIKEENMCFYEMVEDTFHSSENV